MLQNSFPPAVEGEYYSIKYRPNISVVANSKSVTLFQIKLYRKKLSEISGVIRRTSLFEALQQVLYYEQSIQS